MAVGNPELLLENGCTRSFWVHNVFTTSKYTIYSIHYIQQIQHEIYNMYNMKYKTCTRSFLGLTMASPRLKMRRHLPLKSHDAQRSSNASTVLLQHNNNALKKNKLQSCDTFSKNYSALLKYKLSKVFRSYFS